MDGRALTAVGIGAVLVWSGIRGWSVMATLGSIITGVQPSNEVTIPLSNPTTVDGVETIGVAPSAVSGSGIGAAVAAEGLRHQGHAYRFGGSPGRDGRNAWDCSSFVNYVIAVKLGRPIPGYKAGKYTGTSHGPTTGNWAVWPGLTRVKRTEVQAGDILVWVGHMGIAINNTQMINAENPKNGTRIATITGFSRGPLVMMGRLK